MISSKRKDFPSKEGKTISSAIARLKGNDLALKLIGKKRGNHECLDTHASLGLFQLANHSRTQLLATFFWYSRKLKAPSSVLKARRETALRVCLSSAATFCCLQLIAPLKARLSKDSLDSTIRPALLLQSKKTSTSCLIF